MTTLRSGPIDDDDGGGGGDSDRGDGGSAGDTASDDERERANIPQTDPDAGGGDLSGASVDGPTESADAGDAGSPSMLRNQPLAIDREADQTGRQGTPNTTTRAAALERAGESDVTADVSLTDEQLSGGGQTGQTTRTDLAGAVTDDEQQAALRPNQALAEDLQEQGAEAGDVGDFDIPGPVSEGDLRSASTEFVSQFPGRVSKATQLGVPSVSFGPGGVPMASEESADTLTTPASDAGPGGVRGAVLSGTGQAVDPFGAALQGKEIAEAGAYAVAGDGSAGERAGVLAGKGLTLGERTVEQARERPVQTAAAAGVGTLVGTAAYRASPITLRSGASRVASGARRLQSRASDVRTRLEIDSPRRSGVSGLREGERGQLQLGRLEGEAETDTSADTSVDLESLPDEIAGTDPELEQSGPAVPGNPGGFDGGFDSPGGGFGASGGSASPAGFGPGGFDASARPRTDLDAGASEPTVTLGETLDADTRSTLAEVGVDVSAATGAAAQRQRQAQEPAVAIGSVEEPSFESPTPGVDTPRTGSQTLPTVDLPQLSADGTVRPRTEAATRGDVDRSPLSRTRNDIESGTRPRTEGDAGTRTGARPIGGEDVLVRPGARPMADFDAMPTAGGAPETPTPRVRDGEPTRPRDIDLEFDFDDQPRRDRAERFEPLKERFEFEFKSPLGEDLLGGDGDG